MEDLTEEGGFKEECAKTETCELSLDGGVQIYRGKVGRRVNQSVRTGPVVQGGTYLESSPISGAPSLDVGGRAR